MNENLLALYEHLGGDKQFGSIEGFTEALKDPENQQAAFTQAGGDEQFGSFDGFIGALELNPPSPEQPTVPEQIQTEEPQVPVKTATDPNMGWTEWEEEHSGEEDGVLKGIIDWVSGTFNTGMSQGRVGNMFEATNLIQDEDFTFLKDEDYDQLADEFRIQRESQDKLGVEGNMDTGKEVASSLFSSIGSSMIGMLREAASDWDVATDVAASTATGAGIGAAGGAGVGVWFGGVGAGPGAAAGTKAGAETGFFRGLSLAAMHSSADVEVGSIFTERIQKYAAENGLDVENPEDLKKIIADKDFAKAARSDALTGGGIVAIADLATAGLASKVTGGLAGKATSNTVGSMIARRGVVSGIESGGAMVGEGTKQLAIDGELNWTEIWMEGAGELVGGQLQNINSLRRDNQTRKDNITRDALIEVAHSDADIDSFTSALNAAAERGVVNPETAQSLVNSADEVRSMIETLPDDVKANKVRSREAAQLIIDGIQVENQITALGEKSSAAPTGVRKAFDKKRQKLESQKTRIENRLTEIADSDSTFKDTLGDYQLKNDVLTGAAGILGSRPDRATFGFDGGDLIFAEGVSGKVKTAIGKSASKLGLTGPEVPKTVKSYESSGDYSDFNDATVAKRIQDMNSLDIDTNLADDSVDIDIPDSLDGLRSKIKENDNVITGDFPAEAKAAAASANVKLLNAANQKYKAKIDSASKRLKTLKETTPNGDPVGMDAAIERTAIINESLSDTKYNMEVLEDSAYKAKVKSIGGQQNSTAVTNHKTGKIYINGDKANARTFAHEATHAALRSAFKGNEDVTVAGMFEALSERLSTGNNAEQALHKELKDFASNPKYKAEGAEVKASEYISELVGWMVANERRIKQDPSILERIVEAISDFIDQITGVRLTNFDPDVDSVVAFLNRLSDDLASGEKVFSGNGQQVQNSIENLQDIVEDIQDLSAVDRQALLDEHGINDESFTGGIPDIDPENLNTAFEGDSEAVKVNNRTLEAVAEAIGLDPLVDKDYISIKDQIRRAIASGIISEDGAAFDAIDVLNVTDLANMVMQGEALNQSQTTALQVTAARLAKSIQKDSQLIKDNLASGIFENDDTIQRLTDNQNLFDLVANASKVNASALGRMLGQRAHLMVTSIDIDAEHRQFLASVETKMTADMKKRFEGAYADYQRAYKESKDAADAAESRGDRSAERHAKSSMKGMRKKPENRTMGQITKDFLDIYRTESNPDLDHQLDTNDDLDGLTAKMASYINRLAASSIFASRDPSITLANVVSTVKTHLATETLPAGLVRMELTDAQIVRAIALTSPEVKDKHVRHYNKLRRTLDNDNPDSMGTKQILERLDDDVATLRGWAGGGIPAGVFPKVQAIMENLSELTDRVVDRGLGLALGYNKDSDVYQVLSDSRGELVENAYGGGRSDLNALADKLAGVAGMLDLRNASGAVDVTLADSRLQEKIESTNNDSIVDLVVPTGGMRPDPIQVEADMRMQFHRKKYRMIQKEIMLRMKLANTTDPRRRAAISRELRGGSRFKKVWDFTRALKFSIDFSMTLQQGGFALLSGIFDLPGVAANKAFGDGKRYADWKQSAGMFGQTLATFYKDAARGVLKNGSDGHTFTQDLIFQMMASDTGQQAKADGLDFTQVGDADMANREEIFNSELADKIPGIKASANIYTSYLNTVRYHMYREFRRQYPNATADQRQDYVTFIMDATGRNKSVKGLGDGWSAVLSAPRLYLAQARMVLRNAPAAAIRLGKNAAHLGKNGKLFKEFGRYWEGEATKIDVASIEILKRYAKWATGQVALAGLLGVLGWEIEDDPKERNFGRYKKDDTVLDVSSGYQLYWRLPTFALYRMYKGMLGTEDANEQFGEANASQSSLGMRNIGKDVMDALRYKFNPSVGIIFSIIEGKDAIGKSYGTNMADAMGNMVLDMYAPISLEEGIKEMARQIKGQTDKTRISSPSDYNPWNIMSLFGANVIDYENTLNDAGVKDYLNTERVDYNPKVTKKDAEKFIRGFADSTDDNFRLTVQQAYVADVQDILGKWIQDRVDKGRKPPMELIRAKKNLIARKVGREYRAKYFPRKRRN